MRLVGVRSGRRVDVAVQLDDRVTPIAEVGDFYADLEHWIPVARKATVGEQPVGSVELAPPVPPSARVICIGLNYRAHAAEGGFTPPDHPTVFGRWVASLTVDGTPAPVPANEPGLDWEGEVAAIVGRQLTDVDEATARAGVLGYAAFNDLTARTAQKLTAQWTLGKNADRSGPIGPIVTADEVGDLADGLRVQTRVNGEIVQDGTTRDMIFGVGDLLSRISRTFTLNPGDVIATGTPDGVGYVRTPPWLLHPGDVVEVEVDRLGRRPNADRGRRGPPVSDVPVLIVGGGPSGLAAAIELGRRGIEVCVVEPRTMLDPLRARAKTTSVRTMEHFRRWGIADRLREAAPLPVAYAQDVVFCTHLLGHEITRFPAAFGLTVERRDEYAESGQQAPQPVVEQVLRDAAAALPTVTLLPGVARHPSGGRSR